MVLLVGFMTLLVTATLFVFVYAPNPAEPPGFKIPLPEPLQDSVNRSIYGWNQMLSTFDNAGNFSASSTS